MQRIGSRVKGTQRVGSRAQVMHGNAKMTGGGLRKKDLKYNKQGKIVSKKMSQRAKKEKRLQKAGYITKKGQFGAVRSMKGGASKVLKSTKDHVNYYKKIVESDLDALSFDMDEAKEIGSNIEQFLALPDDNFNMENINKYFYPDDYKNRILNWIFGLFADNMLSYSTFSNEQTKFPHETYVMGHEYNIKLQEYLSSKQKKSFLKLTPEEKIELQGFTESNRTHVTSISDFLKKFCKPDSQSINLIKTILTLTKTCIDKCINKFSELFADTNIKSNIQGFFRFFKLEESSPEWHQNKLNNRSISHIDYFRANIYTEYKDLNLIDLLFEKDLPDEGFSTKAHKDKFIQVDLKKTNTVIWNDRTIHHRTPKGIKQEDLPRSFITIDIYTSKKITLPNSLSEFEKISTSNINNGYITNNQN